MLRIYVGCSLTQAPDEFKTFVVNLKVLLKEAGYGVLEFIGLVDGTSTDVYKHDIHECVANCDMLLAICDYPAIGLGWELGTAVEKYGKPTLAVVQKGVGISRLPVGAECELNQNYRFDRYSDAEHIVEMVNIFVEEMNLTAVLADR